MALAVPLSRFTSQVGGGSAFFVRLHDYTTAIESQTVYRGSFVFDAGGCWRVYVHADVYRFGFAFDFRQHLLLFFGTCSVASRHCCADSSP